MQRSLSAGQCVQPMGDIHHVAGQHERQEAKKPLRSGGKIAQTLCGQDGNNDLQSTQQHGCHFSLKGRVGLLRAVFAE